MWGGGGGGGGVVMQSKMGNVRKFRKSCCTSLDLMLALVSIALVKRAYPLPRSCYVTFIHNCALSLYWIRRSKDKLSIAAS